MGKNKGNNKGEKKAQERAAAAMTRQQKRHSKRGENKPPMSIPIPEGEVRVHGGLGVQLGSVSVEVADVANTNVVARFMRVVGKNILSYFDLGREELKARWPSVYNVIHSVAPGEYVFPRDQYVNIEDPYWSPEVVGDEKEGFYLSVLRQS